MKNVEMKKKNAVKVFGASVLMAGTFILGGCGGSTTEKPKDEPTVEETPSKEEPTVENEIPFEKMTEEEMDLLVEGDVVTKIPDSDYLNERGLDFVYIYNTWIRTGDGEYSGNPAAYYTDEYRKDGEDLIMASEDVVKSAQKFELNQIYIGSVTFGKSVKTGMWEKYIKTPSEKSLLVSITSQEKIDELEKSQVQYTK